jgi:hypothetical protein
MIKTYKKANLLCSWVSAYAAHVPYANAMHAEE